MALELSINICTEDCQNLIITETTGAYNVTTNPTGWGTPNPTLVQVDTAYITVTTPAGNSYSFSVQPNLPSSNTTDNYQVNYSDLGMSTGLVDGIYTITYDVTVLIADVPVLYTVTQTTMIICNLECCVDKLLLNVEDWNCDCSKDAREKYLSAFGILKQLEHSIECGDLDTAEDLITMVSKICRNADCSTCK